ncbi:hypothetical protein EVA_20884, partial [gut metagenome]
MKKNYSSHAHNSTRTALAPYSLWALLF